MNLLLLLIFVKPSDSTAMRTRAFLKDIVLLIFLTGFLGSCLRAPQFAVVFSETEKSVSENAGSFDVEFSLPGGDRHQDVEVAYTFGGTAKEGRDYTTGDARFIIIPHGSTSVSFSIDLIDNIEQDGLKTIEIAIILVIQNGNTIYQGAVGQTMVITITDDDCSIYIAGTWEYTADYHMFAGGDTVAVGQDGKRLEEGENPVFKGEITIEDPEGTRNYFISDMMAGMFRGLEIETPCPLLDACGVLSGPNDGSIVLMGELPAYLTGTIEEDSTILLDFEYMDVEQTGGGGGHAHLVRK